MLDLQPLPGLPISGMQFVCPGLAAVLLVGQQQGAVAALAFLRRLTDLHRIRGPRWWLIGLVLMPATALVTYVAMRALERPLPETVVLSGTVAITLAPVLLLAGLSEELGWTGYLVGALEVRTTRFRAALLIGAVWAAWHVLPLTQAQRPLGWIAFWFLGTVLARLVLVWLYLRGGRSVFLVGLCHGTQNLAWQLFPNRGSHFDPAMNTLALALVVGLLLLAEHARARHARSHVG